MGKIFVGRSSTASLNSYINLMYWKLIEYTRAVIFANYYTYVHMYVYWNVENMYEYYAILVGNM